MCARQHRLPPEETTITRIGVIAGSLRNTSINREVAEALIALAPAGVEMHIIDISELPVYSPDYDRDYPKAAREYKDALASVDGLIILTPEYLRSITAALKNALEWGSHPTGESSFDRLPVAIGGVTKGGLGTVAAQQGLRAILGHLNAPTMGQPELFLRYTPEVFPGNGVIGDQAMADRLSAYLDAAVRHVELHAPVAAA